MNKKNTYIKQLKLSDGRIAKLVFAPELIDQKFDLEKLEIAFNASTNIIQDNRNVIKKVTLGDQQTVIKSFKPPNVLQGIIYRYLRTTKARRSYEHSATLKSQSIDTPKPLGYVEVFNRFRLCQSYFISDLLNYDFLIRDIISQPHKDQTDILEQFTQFTFNMHQKGVLHLDYSLGNIGISKENNHYRFSLFVLNARHSMPTLHDTQNTHTAARRRRASAHTAVNPDYWDLVPHSDIHQQLGRSEVVTAYGGYAVTSIRTMCGRQSIAPLQKKAASKGP